MTDLISRAAAIDALKRLQKDISGDYTELGPMAMAGCGYIGDCIGEIQDLPDEEPGIVRCKECKHFHHDMPYVIQGIPILGHEVCDFWGDGCKTNENGFCSYAEQKERSER